LEMPLEGDRIRTLRNSEKVTPFPLKYVAEEDHGN
jgi:hypothetical protein